MFEEFTASPVVRRQCAATVRRIRDARRRHVRRAATAAMRGLGARR